MNPLRDRRFIKYLIGYGIALMICWSIFTLWLLPMYPNRATSGCIGIAGVVTIMIVLGVIFIQDYENGL
jgi:hypothetical protein